ncbi:hypothetical protein K432DRAFT_80370 [Lepidopterella palustris CBS 459.81]|uniref:Uncharacterized protein n=1 Tax=Lepidopterella palustris CBS 459.81 TaxID=1314670 RepID=A0A8E2JE17_9PEZI|nr:hypothetical protein K432DRAFT_80370 [Lepidopterella palustris CBS 459.81]
MLMKRKTSPTTIPSCQFAIFSLAQKYLKEKLGSLTESRSQKPGKDRKGKRPSMFEWLSILKLLPFFPQKKNRKKKKKKKSLAVCSRIEPKKKTRQKEEKPSRLIVKRRRERRQENGKYKVFMKPPVMHKIPHS